MFIVTILAYLSAFIALGTLIVGMGTVYGKTQNVAVLISMIIFVIVFIAAFFIIGVLSVRGLRKRYIDSLFGVTERNLAHINAGEAGLEDYPGGDKVEEFARLNDAVHAVKSSLNNATLVFGDLNYDSFFLEWVEGFDHVATLESFEKQLSNIIASSMNFRNALANIYYDLGNNGLSDAERHAIHQMIVEQFRHYENFLVLLPEDGNSFYIYLPRVDSFAALRHCFDGLLSKMAISKHNVEGYVPLVPHYAIVAYPFSAVHEMFPDLRYARRQGKIAQMYLPNRLHDLGDANIGKNAMHLNQMSKILFNLSSIEATNANKQDVRAGMARVLQALCSELNFEMAGIIAYDQERGGYVFKDHVGPEETIQVGQLVDPDFIPALDASHDPDHSFYFSSRNHVGPQLGKVLDKLSIQSGFFYALKKDGKTYGAVYFINRSKNASLDSYLQESLSAACYHISSSYVQGVLIEDMLEAHRRYDALLAATDSVSYQIEKGTYRILSYSKGMKRIFRGLEEGKACYQCLYGLNSPCADCPLKTGNKKPSQVGKHQFVTSLTIDVQRGQRQTMLLRRVRTEEDYANRYDPELLISSFPTLFEEVSNHYLVGDNGYVLMLRLDNYDQLIRRFGSEGFLLIQRAFIAALKKLGPQYDGFFRYDEKTLGILFPAVGQVDLINRCEEIFRFTKGLTYEGGDTYDLNISYMPMNYPQGYAGANDFFRHVARDLNTRKRDKGSDYIYFDDTDYVRPASRREFILQVIEEQFGKETFRVSLQPMVQGREHRIFGAEILLRIQDEYRHIVFNPEELIRVAEENGKIPLITRALLRYVDSFYQAVGPATLKMFGFKQLALNTDVSLFADQSFDADFGEFLKKSKLPEGFLAFEIAEGDVSKHLEAFEAAAPMLKKHKVHMVIDQYSGRFISLDDVAKLGFEKIKVGRNVVHNIDTDQSRLKAITSLLNEAKEKNINIAIVGVENRDQSDLLYKINPNLELQGYYFYMPLERPALLEAIRNNGKAKD